MQLANTRAFIDNMRGFILRERGKFVSWPYLRLALRSCALWRFLFVFVLACRLRWPFRTRTSVPRWLPHPAHGSDRFPHPVPRGTPTPPHHTGMIFHSERKDSSTMDYMKWLFSALRGSMKPSVVSMWHGPQNCKGIASALCEM